MVTNMFPTDINPTSGVQVKLQTESLRELGIDVDILFMNVRESRFKLNYIKGIWRVAWKTLLNRYDVVHAHFGLSGFVALFQFRSPVVVSFAGGDVMHPYVGKLSRMVARRVNASIVKSDSMKTALRNKDAYIIPNGVDFSFFRPMLMEEARGVLALDKTKKYVLFVGDKGGRVKRFDLIERAFKIAKEGYKGDLELISVYKRPQSEIPIYMNACNVLVLASDWEGSSNVTKEAMACNLPVVSVDVGDAREMINGTMGCFICERRPVSIANGLLKVLRSNTGTNGRERIQHLASESVAKQIIEVYKKVIVGK